MPEQGKKLCPFYAVIIFNLFRFPEVSSNLYSGNAWDGQTVLPVRGMASCDKDGNEAAFRSLACL